MNAAPTPSTGGLVAGKYRLEELIGEGGMGTVWAATNLNLDQRVAIKLITKEHARSAEVRARFVREARAAAMLKSRHAVQVFDSGETEDSTPYIVMELLEGETLEERLSNVGPIPLRETVRVVQQVGKALAKAHALEIVHRDLKPANVFLADSDDDEGYIAKVLDFGIAKLRDSSEERLVTGTNAVMGTPLFMSPEQMRGTPADHRADLYSLGLVTFNMLTGRHALSSEAFGDILLETWTQPLTEIHVVAPWIPRAIDVWMKQACALDPGERFQGAEEMVDALVRAAGLSAGNERALARPLPTPATPTTSSERHPPVVPGGGIERRSFMLGAAVGAGAAIALVIAGAVFALALR